MKALRRFLPLPVLLTCSLALGGCGGGLTLTRVNSEEAKPNNVWIFFTVRDGEEPVAGLAASNFEIYEDGKLVSTFESNQKILNPEMAAVSYTLLLLDMSGSVTESGGAEALVDAALEFSNRVGKQQKVGVYAFDGSEEIDPIVPFTETQGSVEGGIETLRSYKPKDPSTNLHGAVRKGLETLKAGLDKDDKPLKFGTLVVFTDGTDRAARVSEQEMRESIRHEDYKHYEMFAVGVGGEIDQRTLDMIGKDGSEKVDDTAKVGEAFDRIAARIEKHMKRFYLLSYCTPARKGEHRVRIVAKTGGEQDENAEWGSGEVTREDEMSEEEKKERKKEDTKVEKKSERSKSGRLEYTFVADGFGPPPTCDPERKPEFELEPDQEQENGSSGGKSGDKSKGTGKAGGTAKVHSGT